jgi:histidinol-phosphatase
VRIRTAAARFRTPEPGVSADLELALELADEADALTLARFRAADLVVDTKPDLTPVSEADRAVEERVRRHLARARPDHGVLGEEMGDQPGAAAGSDWRWVVDPIDGTKNYVRGVPVWATLIALQTGARTVVGVVSAPALGRRWWAARGEGAYADGDRIRVSEVATLADASLSYASLSGWEAAGRGEAFLALTRRFWRTRAYGDFWSHVLVAEGAVDVAAEPDVTLWDLAALQVIVEEAGGRFTDLGGTPSAGGGSAVSTNGRLHDEVLAALAGEPLPPR